MAVEEVRSNSGSSSSTPVSVSYGASPVEGNMMVVCFWTRATSVTTPSGWTKEATVGTGDEHCVFTKVAGSSEGTSQNFSLSATDQTAWGYYELENVDSVIDTATEDTTGSTTSRSSGTTTEDANFGDYAIASFGSREDISSQSFTNGFTLDLNAATSSVIAEITTAVKPIYVSESVETTMSWTTSSSTRGLVITFKASDTHPLTRPPLKPGRWSVDQAQVDPRWQSFWTNLVWAAPLWEGTGLPLAYPTRTVASTANGTWEPTLHGWGHRLNETGTGDSIEWPEHAAHDLQGDLEFTLFLAYNWTGYSGGNPTYISHRDTFGAGAWSVTYASIGVDEKTDFVFHDGTGNQYTNFGSNSWPGEGYHTMCITREKGGLYKLYIDGHYYAQSTVTTSLPTTGGETHKLYLGELSEGEQNQNVEGDYLVFYLWKDRALSAGDVLRLDADPYGPFRKAHELQATPAAETLTKRWGIPYKG